MATSIAIVDMEKGELKFMMNDKEVTFSVHRMMKNPSNMMVFSVMNYLDDHGGPLFGYLDEV